MEALVIGPDLSGWTGSFMSNRQMKLIFDGEVGEANSVDSGIPRGPPTALILFVTYLPGIFGEVDKAVPGTRGQSLADAFDGGRTAGVTRQLRSSCPAAAAPID